MNLRIAAMLLGLAFPLAPACGDGEKSPYPLDDILRLNHVQAKGTHNSYHIEPDIPRDPSMFYTHAPLEVQFEVQGVRQVELDLHYRTGEGFEVFHLPDMIDSETTCRRFVDCLKIIKNWSDKNRWHMPIVIWIEPKDDIDFADSTLELIVGHYTDMEEEIFSVWPKKRILRPDDVRGDYATLPEALAADGWPTLGELRQKVIFAFLDNETHRQNYIDGAENLAGKLLFVDTSDPAEPYAAFIKVNNAQADFDLTQDLVKTGFIVTTNTDSVEIPSEENQTRLDGCLGSGAHYLSTDIPVPDEGREYWFDLPPGGAPARCNPLTAPTACTPADIESLP